MSRDARQAWIRALESVAAMQRDPALILPTLLETQAEAHAARPALLGPGERLTYADLARRMRQIAAWAATRPAGTVLGLLVPNRPDYPAIWLGLTRAGCVVALLNPNLTGDVLAHAVRAVACTAIVVDPALRPQAEACGLPLLDPADLIAPEPAAATATSPTPKPSDTALLIFTSGTTGLPKASRLTHARVLEWALWFGAMMDLVPDDRIFDCLPLYHSTGGVVAVGASLVRGASVQIAPAFSARSFWDDVADNDCTVFFYIGELCRYLTNAPPHPKERAHRLRLAVGNGLQEAVWSPFATRFALPKILEFYAATEGGVSLYNCEGKPGAIGRVPPFLQSRFPLALIRIDPDTGAPLRGPDGLCLPAPDGEPGEALGRLDATRRFDGYTDPEASQKKLLTDVLASGDRWFRSGDLMRRDAAGFHYFVDRIGDTFRWKGQNVSTSEVAAIVRTCPGVLDAVVYGVIVPGQEGRAGMAALVPAEDFTPAALAAHCAARLPSYAQPLFLRLCPTLDLTGTFKLIPARLAAEGFSQLPDPIWFRTPTGYIPCDPALIQALTQGHLRT